MIAHQSASNGFVWSPSAVALLRERHEAGDSSRAIAETISRHFGVPITRNAVIGKRMRLGLARSEEFKAQSMRAASEREAKKREAAKEQVRRVTEREAARLAKLARLQSDQNPKEDNVIVLNTRVHPDTFSVSPKVMMDPCFCGCRWPLERRAENGDMLFCTNPTSDVLEPYCAQHKRRAYSKVRTPAQIAADERDRERRAANARAMGLRNSQAFSARRVAR